MDLNPRVFNYSLKNCPIPHPEAYIKTLIHKTSHFLRRLRWRVYFHLQKKDDSSSDSDSDETPPKHYGFPSPNSPPKIPELADLEADLWKLVDSVSFSDNRTHFQKVLSCDARKIRNSKNVIVPADKTRNYYEIKPEKYETLLHNNITANYRKCDPAMAADVNVEAKKLAKELDLADRVEVMSQTPAFITLKDHKNNFQTDTKCRLINPAKPQLGKVSSQILQKINANVREATGLRQWRANQDVIDWFDNIDGKKRKEFVQLDIVDFYPSISKTLLEKAIKFARKFCFISKTEEGVIMNCRKTILFSGEDQWVKKEAPFDVSMGAYDGAEIAELVGLLILHTLKLVAPGIDFGLYRDDGLGESDPLTAKRKDQMRKKIIKAMKDLGLAITIEFGLKMVDYLDMTLDLQTSAYKPFRKPNDTPSYIHIHSNHPPNIIKQLPKMVNTRLCNISSNPEVFHEAVPEYQAALEKSGYKEKLKFGRPEPKRRQRKRQVTWYNPPFNIACTTNIGKEFLKIIDRRFPPHIKRKDKLEKIINRHTIKLSYSGTPNMERIISSHNTKILNERREKDESAELCNCQRGANTCPIGGKCLVSALVYKATIKTDDGVTKTYTGCTDRTFKKRHYGHTADLKHRENRKNTKLAEYVWNKRDAGVEVTSIDWEIEKECHKYAPGGDKCDVCLTEKLCIMKNRDPRTINKRSELMNSCLHKWRWKLAQVNAR